MLKRFIIIICGLGFLSSSCIKEVELNTVPTRTVLFYLAGDNNLSENITAEIESIRGSWKYTGNKCLIYIDTKDEAPRLLRVRGGCKRNPTPYIQEVATYPEENSASAEVFARVIKDVVSNYPADSYGLVFASHSSGWLPVGALSRANRSIGVDRGSAGNKEMELSAFVTAIPDRQFDFIVFESCLMAGVEVAYALRHKTEYILASSAEILSPGFVPIYHSSLLQLFDTSKSVEDGLKSFAQSYYTWIDSQSGVYRSATISLIKTRFLDSLATLATKVYANSPNSFDVGSLQHFDRLGCYNPDLQSPCYFDFMNYMESLAENQQYRTLKSVMEKIVVYKAATPEFMLDYNGFVIRKHSGLTVYAEQKHDEKLNIAYHQTWWWKVTHP